MNDAYVVDKQIELGIVPPDTRDTWVPPSKRNEESRILEVLSDEEGHRPNGDKPFSLNPFADFKRPDRSVHRIAEDEDFEEPFASDGDEPTDNGGSIGNSAGTNGSEVKVMVKVI